MLQQLFNKYLVNPVYYDGGIFVTSVHFLKHFEYPDYK
jgi:hypothetical protein